MNQMRLLKINQILRVHLYWLAECISANPGVKKLLSWKHPSLVLKTKLQTERSSEDIFLNKELRRSWMEM